MNSLSVHANWPEALATVLECKYEFGAGQALAFGVPKTKHFCIHYNYFADGALHEGQFNAEKPIPQGSLFPIRYNPDAVHEHHHENSSTTTSGSKNALLMIGIAGSVILSLAWLLVLRGCY
jgi:hypothetical protein